MAGFSFVVANVGLTQIISLAIPVLMFIYPLAIALILSTYAAYFFHHDTRFYKWPAAFTILAALGDALSVLSPAIKETGFVKRFFRSTPCCLFLQMAWPGSCRPSSGWSWP